MTTFNFILQDIETAAYWLLEQNGNKPAVFLFNAPMGTGKTTLISALCLVLGVQNPVSSPTFAIINEYSTSDNEPVFHIDAYRLKNEAEAINAGVEDCLYSKAYCFVEWPGIIAGIIPEDAIKVQIELAANNERKLSIKQ